MLFYMKCLRVSYLKISTEYHTEIVGFQLGKRSWEIKNHTKLSKLQ